MKIELTSETIGGLYELLDYWSGEPCYCPSAPEHTEAGDECMVCKAKAAGEALSKARGESLMSQANAKALEDWNRIKGKVVVLHPGVDVMGYKDDDSDNIMLDSFAIVQFHDSTDEQSILHWNDDYLDPHWDIELLQPHPQLSPLRSLWINGLAYLLCVTKIELQPTPAVMLMDQFIHEEGTLAGAIAWLERNRQDKGRTVG